MFGVQVACYDCSFIVTLENVRERLLQVFNIRCFANVHTENARAGIDFDLDGLDDLCFVFQLEA